LGGEACEKETLGLRTRQTKNIDSMETLSRREEDSLIKSTKARALKECDPIVKEFAECATGRTVSVVWACKDKYKAVQACMLQFTGQENMDRLRAEYIRQRQKDPVLSPKASS